MSTPKSKMPDIIASTHAAIGQNAGDEELVNLVSAVRRPAPKDESTPDAGMPVGYHPQVLAESPAARYKRPARTERRAHVVNMRLTAEERERFYSFCEARNLSLPDGLMMLLDAPKGTSG